MTPLPYVGARPPAPACAPGGCTGAVRALY